MGLRGGDPRTDAQKLLLPNRNLSRELNGRAIQPRGGPTMGLRGGGPRTDAKNAVPQQEFIKELTSRGRGTICALGPTS